MTEPTATTTRPQSLVLTGGKLFNEWTTWWSELSFAWKALPLVLVPAYWITLWAIGGLKGDHVFFGAAYLALHYGGPRIRPIYWFAAPFILTGIFYDSLRFYTHLLRGPINVAEPYLIEKAWFGIETAAGRLTPNEWLQTRTHPFLDAISGVAYLGYILQYVLVAGYFCVRFRPQAYVLPWSFLALNILGYITYHLYPAAPPWYVGLYGLDNLVLDVKPSPAGAARFDELFGVTLFAAMYTKGSNVFGAIPSLHAAYPLLAVFYAFRFKSLRVFCVGFCLLMGFAAVYLNHHYVLDVLWGSAYSILVALAFQWLASSGRAPEPLRSWLRPR